MQVVIRDDGAVRIVECAEAVSRVDDALDIVAACSEHSSTLVLIESRFLPPAFFDLSSRFAGEFLQKLQNYGVRLAVLLPREATYSERFREFLSESRLGRSFRPFAAREEAEAWLAAV